MKAEFLVDLYLVGQWPKGWLRGREHKGIMFGISSRKHNMIKGGNKQSRGGPLAGLEDPAE